MTPLGIAIGIVSTQFYDGPNGKLASAIILSISCGSFFFISLVELIPSGLNMPGWHRAKMTAVFIGWGLMAFIALYV
jgi:zinc transporter ZupT